MLRLDLPVKLATIFLLALLIVAGCSGGGENPAAPAGAPDVSVPEKEAASGRVLWGIWGIDFDPVAMTATAIPDRNAYMHVNITGMVLPPACDDCLEIKIYNFDPDTRILKTDVVLRNRYSVSGRDVRGILYTNDAGHRLVNADDWTDFWDIPGGEDISPFRAFAKYTLKRIFAAGAKYTEQYLIYIPQPPKYNAIKFAVDASWPANCKEPYAIENFKQLELLWPNEGATAELQVDARDWQNNVNAVKIAAGDITGQDLTPFTHQGGNTWTLTLVNNEAAVVGEYNLRLLATSADSGITALYDYVTISIVEPVPEVAAIKPASAYRGETSKLATVTGANFQGPGAQVKLKKDGEPDIAADDVVVVTKNAITCVLDIPLDTQLGIYDVEVTNLNGMSSVGQGLFEVLSPVPTFPMPITPANLNFSPSDVFILGNRAYLASGLNGLNLFHIQNPPNTSWFYRFDFDGYANDLVVAGDYAYIAAMDSGLKLVNIDVLWPPGVSGVDTPGQAQGVAVDGDYAFVADGSEGLQIIDISPPLSAHIVNTVDLGLGVEARRVAVDGGYACVAALDNGMKIVDIDPPGSAYVVEEFAVTTCVVDVAMADGYAYLCDEWDGLYIVDIDPPDTPSLVKAVPMVAYSVAIDGGYAYVATDDGADPGVNIVDIDPLEDAAVVNTIPSPGHPRSIAASGGYAYMADSNVGLRVLDVDPYNEASIIRAVHTPVHPRDICLSGDLAFVANETPGILAVNVSDPSEAAVIESVDCGEASCVCASSDYAYVTDWNVGLYIIDIVPLADAHIVNTVPLAGEPNAVAQDGGYAYVAARSAGLHILDVDPPESASVVNTVPTTDSAEDVVVAGGYAYVADANGGVHIIDIDPPESASIANTVTLPEATAHLCFDNGYIYATAGDNLYIIDVDPPASASVANSVTTPDVAEGVVVSDGYAYVATATQGMQVIDVLPVESASILCWRPTRNYAYSVDVVDNYAYIGDLGFGLHVIKLW